jgi:hypothetical protein
MVDFRPSKREIDRRSPWVAQIAPVGSRLIEATKLWASPSPASQNRHSVELAACTARTVNPSRQTLGRSRLGQHLIVMSPSAHQSNVRSSRLPMTRRASAVSETSFRIDRDKPDRQERRAVLIPVFRPQSVPNIGSPSPLASLSTKIGGTFCIGSDDDIRRSEGSAKTATFVRTTRENPHSNPVAFAGLPLPACSSGVSPGHGRPEWHHTNRTSGPTLEIRRRFPYDMFGLRNWWPVHEDPHRR